MGYTSTNANGSRRRTLVARVKASETHCGLCGEPVDKTLTYQVGRHGKKCADKSCTGCVPHPRRGEVDEDVPRIRGGSQYDRSNCHLMHRECNRWKSTMTLDEAKAKLAQKEADSPRVVASDGW